MTAIVFLCLWLRRKNWWQFGTLETGAGPSVVALGHVTATDNTEGGWLKSRAAPWPSVTCAVTWSRVGVISPSPVWRHLVFILKLHNASSHTFMASMKEVVTWMVTWLRRYVTRRSLLWFRGPVVSWLMAAFRRTECFTVIFLLPQNLYIWLFYSTRFLSNIARSINSQLNGRCPDATQTWSRGLIVTGKTLRCIISCILCQIHFSESRYHGSSAGFWTI